MTREDVDQAVASATIVTVGEPATAQPRHFAAADIPHDRMRLKIAENMVRAFGTATRDGAVRGRLRPSNAKAALAERGVKLSVYRLHRQSRGRGDGCGAGDQRPVEEGLHRDSPTIDIGVGTAPGEKGLVVPVVKDAGGCPRADRGEAR